MRKGLIVMLAVGLITAACGSNFESVHAPTLIPWKRAEELILADQVRGVVRLAPDQVRLLLRDGRRLVSAEPAPGESSRVIERCGEPCAGILVQ